MNHENLFLPSRKREGKAKGLKCAYLLAPCLPLQEIYAVIERILSDYRFGPADSLAHITFTGYVSDEVVFDKPL